MQPVLEQRFFSWADTQFKSTRLTPEDLKKWFTNAAEMEAKLPKKPVMLMSTWLKTHKLTAADVEALVAYMRSLK